MKTGILLAAFGSGNPDAIRTLGRFEETVRSRFVDIPVRWAFTSMTIRHKLADKGKKTDSVHKALRKMWYEKYTHVAVQPLHVVPGKEYHEILHDAEMMTAAEEGFERVIVGDPLLTSAADIEEAVEAVLHHAPKERRAEDALILMGHGTKHSGDEQYSILSKALHNRDPKVYIGTMDGGETLYSVLQRLKPDGIRKAWLMPLLAVAGRHVIKDMAGPEPDSWMSQIQAQGIECESVLKGTAEYESFARIWIDHLKVSMQHLPDPTA